MNFDTYTFINPATLEAEFPLEIEESSVLREVGGILRMRSSEEIKILCNHPFFTLVD